MGQSKTDNILTSLNGKVIQRNGFDPSRTYIEMKVSRVGDSSNRKGSHFKVIGKRLRCDMAEFQSVLIFIAEMTNHVFRNNKPYPSCTFASKIKNVCHHKGPPLKI